MAIKFDLAYEAARDSVGAERWDQMPFAQRETIVIEFIRRLDVEEAWRLSSADKATKH